MSNYEKLISIIAEKDLQGLQLQLNQGADPNDRDQNGWTLLHWAAQEGSPAIIRCLVARGAKIDAQESKGFTPLAIAIGEAGDEGIIEKTAALLNENASPNIRITSNDGGTMLHTAASYGWFEIVKLLVQTEGIELNSKDDEDRTPLHFARENGAKEIIEYLIQHRAKD